MNFKLLSIAMLAIFLSGTTFAQVQLNVIFRPLAQIDVFHSDIQCVVENKDLHVSVPLETFVIPDGEVLRFELLKVNPTKSYTLTYNNKVRVLLTEKRPYFIARVGLKDESHRFDLIIPNASLQSCEKIRESIRLSLEPM